MDSTVTSAQVLEDKLHQLNADKYDARILIQALGLCIEKTDMIKCLQL